MLEKRHIESTLYLGTAKDNHGELIAHAWLRSGSFMLLDQKEWRNLLSLDHLQRG